MNDLVSVYQQYLDATANMIARRKKKVQSLSDNNSMNLLYCSEAKREDKSECPTSRLNFYIACYGSLTFSNPIKVRVMVGNT